MSLDELKNNKLRSGLSLTGVAFGIFCIISVLALVGSLKQKIQDGINGLGTNTIYVDKWEYVNTTEYPWWKFVNRPTPKFEDVKLIEQRSSLAKNVAFFTQNNTSLSYKNIELQFVNLYGVSEEYDQIQKIDLAAGRYFSGSEFIHGNPVAVIGYQNATDLYGGHRYAIGKTVQFGSHRATIIGVIAKQGQNFGPGFDYDNSLMLTYFYYASIFNVNDESSSPFIMVQGKPNVPSQALVDDLEGVMRQVRKLSPKQEDNFALNDVNYIGTSSINSFLEQ